MKRIPWLVELGAALVAAPGICCSSDPGSIQDDSLRVVGLALPENPGEAALGECTSALGAQDEAREPAERFRSCTADDECVAVAVVGCCHNGWKAAVNRDEAQDYQASFRCPQRRPICPLYIVRDERLPECDRATRLCEMVSPDASGQCAPASNP